MAPQSSGGASVIIVDMDHDAETRTVRWVVEAGGEAQFVAANVSRSDEVRAYINVALSRSGRADCNADIEARIARGRQPLRRKIETRTSLEEMISETYAGVDGTLFSRNRVPITATPDKMTERLKRAP